MPRPAISVVVCTYERPDNLRRVLASIEGQKGCTGNIEVIVADDGSRDETVDVFKQFRHRVNFPVHFVTHSHNGFCPSRCRNEGVAASSAAYLLLLDGDCLIPPNFLQLQLDRRRRGTVLVGDSLRLTKAESDMVDESLARSGGYEGLAGWPRRAHLWKKAIKDSVYGLVCHPVKPHLFGNNVGIWRDDYIRVNGFDENYVGWGSEDNDFGLRLRRAGIRLRTMLLKAYPYHLWHPVESTCPERIRHGVNHAYFSRALRLTRTANGMIKRGAQDLRFQFVGLPKDRDACLRLLPRWCRLEPHDPKNPADVEVLMSPSHQQFSNRADCNLLVVPAGSQVSRRQQRQAHLVLASNPIPITKPHVQFKLHQLESALHLLLRNTTHVKPHCASAA